MTSATAQLQLKFLLKFQITETRLERGQSEREACRTVSPILRTEWSEFWYIRMTDKCTVLFFYILRKMLKAKIGEMLPVLLTSKIGRAVFVGWNFFH